MNAPLVLARCAFCGFAAPVEEEDLTGDGAGDLSVLVMVVPPEGWIGLPDEDGIAHRHCAAGAVDYAFDVNGEPLDLVEWWDRQREEAAYLLGAERVDSRVDDDDDLDDDDDDED